MTRSTASWIALVAVVALAAIVGLVPVPYSLLSPGPVCNALGGPSGSCPTTMRASSFVEVPGGGYPSASRLGFTTVYEGRTNPSMWEVLYTWFSPGHAVVPQELLHPPGESAAAQRAKDRQDMVDAQDAAVVAAETVLGTVQAQIQTVYDSSPANGVLKPKDLVLAVDGVPVANSAALLAALQGTDTTRTYALTISRDGRTSSVQLHRGTVTPNDQKPYVGFGFVATNQGTTPVTLTLDPGKIGGPSAGLMFALAVYDRLTPGDLAGSTTTVAGTGTIDQGPQLGRDAPVGPIGGIQQKMYAARHDFHATVFLAPKGDCGETHGAVPAGLQVVSVATFGDALDDLAKIKAGDLAGLPSC